MKKIICLLLSCSLLLTACSLDTDAIVSSDEASTEINIDNTVEDATKIDESIDEEKLESEDVETVENKSENDEVISADLSFNSLDDEKLLEYVEDNVYEQLVAELNSEDYFVENIEAIYYPKEYIDALASNSRSNVYFGYTADELDAQFQGTKYVFTLGEDGQTIVVPMETLSDDIYVKAMEDVIVGTGVILICVTVSAVAAPAAPAVNMIFAASASTGAKFALASGGIGSIAVGIVKGYETESFEQAMNAAVQGGGKGFKWGAISGAVIGGASKTIALKGATLNGLTMNEAAKIQKDSGYPLEVIKQFKSYKEYEVYKEAGLYTKMVNGKLSLVRKIDLDYVSELPNGESVSNLVRMQKGYAPIDPATGKAYQLHHINQDSNGTLAILTEAEHQGNSAILNLFGKESEIDRKAFVKIRKEFWQKYAATLL